MSKKKTAKPAAEPVARNRRYLDNPDNPRRRAEDANVPAAQAAPQPYPAHRYHEDGGSRIVQNAAEDEALGDGWSEIPSAAPVSYPAWRYHASMGPRHVASAEEDAGLGPGWYPTVKAAAASAA